jgi:hypothetical protein
MFGSAILDVAIGMVFLYLLLSLLCSAVNEMIEAWLKNRSNDLEHGVFRLLADSNSQLPTYWQNVWDRLRGTFHLREKPAAVHQPTPGLASRLYGHGLVRCLYPDNHNLPAYIPAGTFALALMDLLAPVFGASGATQSSGRTTPSAEDFYHAVENSVMPDEVRQALLTLCQAAGNDAVQIRLNIENWYNSAMERVSGWYKRRTQITILVLGLVVAVFVNADTLAMMKSLWTNTSLRTALANTAAAPGTSISPQSTLDTLQALGLPIGWTAAPSPRDTMNLFLAHGLGWLLTAFAVSLGAPFWFDLLNKFVVVRSTVKPQEKSSIEASKD